MPRRTRPRQTIAIGCATAAVALRPKIESILLERSIGKTLCPVDREKLIESLVYAVGFAQIDLGVLLAGKRSRPAARTLDNLTKDVSDCPSSDHLRQLAS